MKPAMFPLIVGTVALLTTSGCATGASPLPRSTAAALATERGAPVQLVSTLQRRGYLTLADIQKLANLQIPDDVTLTYLRDSGAAYELTTAQIDQLRAGDVSDRVIDYLLSTPAQIARVVHRSGPWIGYSYSRYGFGHFSGLGLSVGHHGGGHHGGHH